MTTPPTTPDTTTTTPPLVTMSSGCCGGSCGPSGPVARPDRPHVFFSHGMTRCLKCNAEVEGRIVFKDSKVFNRAFCPGCKADTEQQIHGNAGEYMAAFLDKAKQARESVKSENCFAEKQALLQGIRESEKLLWVKASLTLLSANLLGFHLVECAMKLKFAGTDGLTLALCPGKSSRASRNQGSKIQSFS